jgi:5-methylcytosine-specific restriction endonuclease McrA
MDGNIMERKRNYAKHNNIPEDQINSLGIYTYNGLDRIDNTQQLHNVENLVPCCSICNYAKRDFTTDEFLSHMKLVYQNYDNVIKNDFSIQNIIKENSKLIKIENDLLLKNNNIDKTPTYEIKANGKYGRLTCLYFINSYRAMFQCSCDNKTKKEIDIRYVKSGESRSCGCFVNKNQNLKTSIRHRYFSYLDEDKNRKMSANLKLEEFEAAIQLDCYYCKSKPLNKLTYDYYDKGIKTEKVYLYNGVDRIDSAKGHDIENIVPCCYKCNSAKKQLSVIDFINKAKEICEFNK